MADTIFSGAMPPHTLRTPRLTLRCWSPADAPLLKAAVDSSLEHLRPWMPWAHHDPSPLPEVEQRLAGFRETFIAGTNWIYGIFDRDEQRVLGGTGLHPRVGRDGLEIGYWIAADCVGNGYATEAAMAMTHIAFERCLVEWMEIRCDPRNMASAAIPPKLGYHHERTVEACTTDPDGSTRDAMVWVLTREEYPASVAAKMKVMENDER